MKKLLSVLMLLGIVLSVAVPVSAKAPNFGELRPGRTVTYQQEVPIKIALVGFDESDVDEDALLAQLSNSYRPVVGNAEFYPPEFQRALDLNFEFEYDIINTGNRFEDAFFGYLEDIGTEGPPTLFQQCYSGTAPNLPDTTPNPCNQTGSQLDIEESLYIDAPSVEQWLATEGRELLDTDEDNAYFLYFINWHSRDDFQFHVYTKTGEPDPDTGVDFGERQSRRLIAWGGEQSRLWFYDFSAGPDAFTSNYDINNEDVDGDEVPDYRIPPIWEYADQGYRDFAELPKDIGLLTRYVAVNLLFTTSPVYEPMNTIPGLGGKRVVHIEVLQLDPSSDGRNYIDAAFIREKLEALAPYYEWQVVVEQTKPVDKATERAFRIFAGLEPPGPNDCASDLPEDPYYGLFCFLRDNADRFIPEYGENDYVIQSFAFDISDEYLTGNVPLGVALDDYATGGQTYVLGFDSPLLREIGYGFTTTFIHEVGHHIGLFHPFDGYDPGTETVYGPSGETFFTWAGGESNSMMSYIDVNWDFSQFDRDNVHRWDMASFLNSANNLLDEILADPEADSVNPLLRQADDDARAARRAFERWNYLEAATRAYNAYNLVRTAAEQLGVSTEAPASIQSVGPLKPLNPALIDPIPGHVR
jgi:hypothetical protein